MVMQPEETDEWIAYISMWAALVFSLVSGLFYYKEFRALRCGWEVMYVAILETVNYIFLIGWGDLSPFYWKIDTKCHGEDDESGCWGGADRVINEVPVARYMEWLITCPVLLIALSNLTGLKDDYNWRTMKLLTADQGTILFGATGAMASGSIKAVFFVVGVSYGIVTYFTCLEVYVESYANVPPNAKKTVSIMAYMFFMSWLCFPLFWLLGEEGFGHVNQNMSTILHSIADLFSKNLWGLYSWYLRVQVREYHRKKWFEEQERMKVGEKEFEVPKERRPGLEAGNVAAIFKGEEVDEEIDPSYADYRRQRRRNRGRSISEPDPLSAGLNILGIMNQQNNGAQLAAQQEAEQKQIKMQQKLAMMNNNPMGMQQGMGMQQQTPLNIVVLDNMGFQTSMVLTQKLQMEMGGMCTNVGSKPELFNQMQLAMAQGRSIDMVLVLDGLITASDAIMLHQNFQVSVVQYGPNMSPQQTFGEGYLRTPQPGQMFNPSELWMVVNKLRTKQLATANMPMGGGMQGQMQQPGGMQQGQMHQPGAMQGMQQGQMHQPGTMQQPGTMHQPGGMQQPGGTQPGNDANGASVEVLMAEMNALKSYLSANQ